MISVKTANYQKLKGLLFLLVFVSTGAMAGPGNIFHMRDANRQNDSQRQLSPDNQRDQQRREFQRNESREYQRSQRLSPDERRQLRRDIKDAGREIYPARR